MLIKKQAEGGYLTPTMYMLVTSAYITLSVPESFLTTQSLLVLHFLFHLTGHLMLW